MDKSLLRSVIVGLNPGQEINVTFRGALQNQTGLYETVATKRGRGKGGSWLAELKPLNDQTYTGDSNIEIGTPKNDDILNVTVNGVCSGYTEESEVPANYETNTGNAVSLKETFKTLMDAAETRPIVSIDAPGAPEINGTFLVFGARQLRGRGGQIVLSLERVVEDAHVNTIFERPEVWSYRHSGVIRSFSIVD